MTVSEWNDLLTMVAWNYQVIYASKKYHKKKTYHNFIRKYEDYWVQMSTLVRSTSETILTNYNF